MSRPLFAILLTTSVAFPGASLALGLGELHVESALGQSFVAHIDLLDASHEDLARLNAAMADEDVFQRYQLERPSFLTGTTVAVAQDANGQPVLRVRSEQSFSEPVVTFLVDVRWLGGELIREYTAFLDPPGLAPMAQDTAPETAAPPTHALVNTEAAVPPMPAALARSTSATAPTQVAAAHSTPATAPLPMHAATAPDRKPHIASYTVRRGDTLARIASIVGARSRKEHNRMMIALYRANPAAFQASFNALHSGAVLRVPSAEELATISQADADREYKAQFAARHATSPHSLPMRRGKHATPAAEAPKPSVPSVAADLKPNTGSLEADRLALTHRVQSLEQSLQAVRRELQQRTQQTVAPLPASAAPAEAAPVAQADEPSDESTAHSYPRAPFIALLGGLVLTLAAGLWWTMRRREEDGPWGTLHAAPNSPVAEEPRKLPVETPSAQPLILEPTASLPMLSRASTGSVETDEESRAVNPPPVSTATAPQQAAEQTDTGQTTAILAPEIEERGDTAEHKFAFYNPASLDDTHVVMGSDLTRPLAFIERRKNPAVVLQQAIEREPNRSDLYLKLLELYYATASENRLAFLEATRQIMQKKGCVSAEDWARILDMGRHIAPDDPLFRSDADDQAVA